MGAGAKYGPTALAVGTTVKLARALWIVPLAIATAMLKEEQGEGAVALVYLVLLRCGCDGELCAEVSAAVSGVVFGAEPIGSSGVDRGVVSDRHRHYAEHAEGSRRAATGSGSDVVDCCGESVALGDPRGMDCAVIDVVAHRVART